MNIIISAGGTGGHIYPALAIINKFKEKEKDVNVLYIGTHNRMEKEIVPSMGIRYEEIEIYGFSKKLILRDIKDIFLIFKAKKKCVKLMKKFKPDVVIGVGGYVTMPVIMAAKSLNIPCVLHEQNSIPGKTNKILSNDIDLMCTSYENSSKYFKNAKKIVYTGNPCGENALTVKKINKSEYGLSKNKKLVVVVSGSLGSMTTNEFFSKYLSLIDNENYEILYITGKNYYDDFIKDKEFSKNVKVVPYVENLSGLLSSCDLIITRAGAGTISEILALELPSIIIPSPYVANNHQYYNALDLQNKGVSIMIEEKNLDAEKLYKKVNELLEDNNKEYKKIKNNLAKLDMKNSSTLIYKEIKELIK